MIGPRRETARTDALFLLHALAEDGLQEFFRLGEPPKPSSQDGMPAHRKQSLSREKPAESQEKLLHLQAEVRQCVRCSELAQTRKTVVFGSGNPRAEVMFIGEAPGRDEDEQGLPFVGKAGQLLTKIIESIGLTRHQVFIANVLKCRPPGNRPPKPEEVLNCASYLVEQISLIRPRVICALGTFAAQALLKTGQPISRLRGTVHTWDHGTRLICTFHPAYLLRNPQDKRKVWEDMKRLRRELDRMAGGAPP